MSTESIYPAVQPSLDLNFAAGNFDPRITFSRASAATYYDGKTVAKAEENLLKYSQEFDNAAWAKQSGTTVTANQAVAPDGTTTADLVTGSGTSGLYQFVAGSGTNLNTKSVWIRAVTGTPIVNIKDPASTVGTLVCNLTTSWQRFSLSETNTTSGGWAYGLWVFNIPAEGIYIWGAQLEVRSAATAYTPTTSQPITNYIPVLQTAPANVPRIDHDPVTGECKGLLIEEQRTNLLTYSEQFENAAWERTFSIVTSNAAVAPNGTLTGEKLIPTTVANQHSIQMGIGSVTAGTTHTLSVYAKAGEYRHLSLTRFDGATYYMMAGFDLVAGTVNPASIGTCTMVPVENGWYRCSVTAAATNTADYWFGIRGNPDAAITSVTPGDGYSGIYVWGAQLEAGSFPTSYIKTEASQVTRAVDSASMTGANFTSWYRQGDEGTLFAKAAVNFTSGSVVNDFVEANDGTQTNFFGTFVGLTTGFQAGQMVSVATTVSARARNGVVTAFAAPTNQLEKTQLQIGVGRLYYMTTGWYKRIAYYPKRLSDAQLQALTA